MPEQNEFARTIVTKIPVFGDIHGNLEGMIETIKHLQDKTGETFRFAFQLGDFGYTTIIPKLFESRFQFSVSFYLNQKNPSNYFLGLHPNFKLFFLRGNHEDHSYLDQLTKTYLGGTPSADKYNKLFYFPDGRAISIQTGPLTDITIAALGGINKESRPKAYTRNPLVAFTDEAIQSLLDFKDLDILMTHQGTDKVIKGHSEITTLIELLQPKLHLHGHSHRFSNIEIGKTKSIGLGMMPQVQRPYLKNKDYYCIIDLEKMERIG